MGRFLVAISLIPSTGLDAGKIRLDLAASSRNPSEWQPNHQPRSVGRRNHHTLVECQGLPPCSVRYSGHRWLVRAHACRAASAHARGTPFPRQTESGTKLYSRAPKPRERRKSYYEDLAKAKAEENDRNRVARREELARLRQQKQSNEAEMKKITEKRQERERAA